MLFGFTTEWRSASERNRVHLRPVSPAIRGIGAFRRKARSEKEFKDLDLKDATTPRLIIDNNTSARLLDSSESDLVK
jgi:hypothetical protein